MDFLQDFSMPVGVCQDIMPGLQRVLAPNPSPFTYTGTQTYLIGKDRLTVIDPGPDNTDHLDALLQAIDKRPVDHILVTHTHLDHSPLTPALKAKTGARTYGFGTHGSGQQWHRAGLDKETVEAGADISFVPDTILRDGDSLAVDGGTLQALHTPGHTSNHLCFFWSDRQMLFSGDHIMGWSTTVIAPPDGHMASYMANLERLLDLPLETLVPTHGPLVQKAGPFIKDLIEHRTQREQQIIDQVSSGIDQIPAIVAKLYQHVDTALHPAAARSVLAHLIKLVEEERVHVAGPPDLHSRFTIQ